MADPQMRRYLSRLAASGGAVYAPDNDLALIHDEPGFERALERGFVSTGSDGGHGAYEYVAITNAGRRAIGMPPEPRWLFAALRWLGVSQR